MKYSRSHPRIFRISSISVFDRFYITWNNLKTNIEIGIFKKLFIFQFFEFSQFHKNQNTIPPIFKIFDLYLYRRMIDYQFIDDPYDEKTGNLSLHHAFISLRNCILDFPSISKFWKGKKLARKSRFLSPFL